MSDFQNEIDHIWELMCNTEVAMLQLSGKLSMRQDCSGILAISDEQRKVTEKFKAWAVYPTLEDV